MLGKVVLPVVVPDLDRVEVDRYRLGLGEELAPDPVLERLPRDAEHAGHHADIDHVGQLLAERVALDLRLGQLGEGHRVVGDVGARLGGRKRLLVDDHAAAAYRRQVLAPRGNVERDQDVDLVRARHVSFRRDPQLVPRGEAFDVGGKDVFGRYRDSHMEDRSGQNQVCGLAARTVDGGGLDGEVVDDWFGHFDFGLADYGFYACAAATLDCLESPGREGGGSQGDRAGRAPRGPRA